MSSQRRLLASRANGALARGRKTAAGIARSAQNALRHGLFARRGLLPDESSESFLELRSQFISRFSPVDDAEKSLIEEMTLYSWRIRRTSALENRIMASTMEPGPVADAISRIADAFTAGVSAPRLDLVSRSEARFHRMFQRALKNLVTLRAQKLRNDPNPISGQPEEPGIPESSLVLFPLPKKSRNDPNPISAQSAAPVKPESNLVPDRAAEVDEVAAALAFIGCSHQASNSLLFPRLKKLRNDPNPISAQSASPAKPESNLVPDRTTEVDEVAAALAFIGCSRQASNSLLFPRLRKLRNDPTAGGE